MLETLDRPTQKLTSHWYVVMTDDVLEENINKSDLCLMQNMVNQLEATVHDIKLENKLFKRAMQGVVLVRTPLIYHHSYINPLLHNTNKLLIIPDHLHCNSKQLSALPKGGEEHDLNAFFTQKKMVHKEEISTEIASNSKIKLNFTWALTLTKNML